MRPGRPKKTSADTLRLGGVLVNVEDLLWDGRLPGVPNRKRVDIIGKRAAAVRARRITYASNGHRVNGFIVEPRTIKGRLPCIIWNRGGSMDFGALEDWQVIAWLGMVAEWGYIVIASQYSGNKGSEGVDQCGGDDVNDVLVLRDVLRRHAHADLRRIGMLGGSRGGMMTYLCLSRVRWIKAAVTIAGLADLSRNMRHRPEMRERYKTMFGAKTKDVAARSAVRWAQRFPKNTALLMMHGTNDKRVSVEDTLDLSRELLKAGRHHGIRIFEGDDHYLTGNWKKRWEMVREWFDRYVKDGGKIKVMPSDLHK